MTLTDLDHEAWLANRLGVHGHRVFEGITTPAERKQRVREAITAVGSLVVCARGNDGKPVTYALAFARLYGEPL